ncbi:MAG: metallophosphoesterase family protein [candidate division Zixibacteria bacterium]|nr:metallophosphoesterase family protein [candidate division Zixibacteria bacterium]
MRCALVSDIHANLEALEAVLRDIDTLRVDQIFSLGDVIGYGADPAACVALVEKHCAVKLMGNHEYVSLGLTDMKKLNTIARESLTWTKSQLGDRSLSDISKYEIEAHTDTNYFVHASPFEPEKWHYILSIDDAAQAFHNLENRMCFFGHTHVPLIFSEIDTSSIRCRTGHSFQPDEECRHLINVGSVGQPRDNDPRACYVLYDTDEQDVEYRRVEYDVQRTQQKMIQANIPRVLAERLETGR